jgi:hypothetical protein
MRAIEKVGPALPEGLSQALQAGTKTAAVQEDAT